MIWFVQEYIRRLTDLTRLNQQFEVTK